MSVNRISQLFQQFEGTAQNPPKGMDEDDLSLFLRAISESGDLMDFSESEWISFGREEGLNDDQVAELVEQAAGWVADSTEGGRRRPEPAEWA